MENNPPKDEAPPLGHALRGPRSRAESEGRAVLSLAFGMAALIHAGFLIAAWAAPEQPKKREETRERVIETMRVEDVHREPTVTREVPPALPLRRAAQEEPAAFVAAALSEPPAPRAEPEPPPAPVDPPPARVPPRLPRVEPPTTVAAQVPPPPLQLPDPPATTPEPEAALAEAASGTVEPLPSPAAVPAPTEPEVTAAPLKHDRPPRPPTKRGALRRGKDRTGQLVAVLGSLDEGSNVAMLSVLTSSAMDDVLEGGAAVGLSGLAAGVAAGGTGSGGFRVGAAAELRDGGIGSALTSADEELLAWYIRKVTKALRKEYEYPRAASRRRIQGTVLLELVIAEDGHVVKRRVARSSGHPVLDDAALAAARRVSTVPQPPPGLHWTRRAIRVPFVYTLR